MIGEDGEEMTRDGEGWKDCGKSREGWGGLKQRRGGRGGGGGVVALQI